MTISTISAASPTSPATTSSSKPPTRTRAKIVDVARSWVGTPYEHRQQAKGFGVDCVGVILGVGAEAQVLEIATAAWVRFARYAKRPNPRKVVEALELFMRREPDSSPPAPGLVALIEWRRGLPMHLAIVGQVGARLTLIHALEDFGRCVEHDLSALWRSRIVSLWRYPGA